MTLTPHHTSSEWAWRWRDGLCQREIAWLPERERWLVRTRVGEGGWSQPQQVRLPPVDDEDSAERIAADYAGEETP